MPKHFIERYPSKEKHSSLPWLRGRKDDELLLVHGEGGFREKAMGVGGRRSGKAVEEATEHADGEHPEVEEAEGSAEGRTGEEEGLVRTETKS